MPSDSGRPPPSSTARLAVAVAVAAGLEHRVVGVVVAEIPGQVGPAMGRGKTQKMKHRKGKRESHHLSGEVTSKDESGRKQKLEWLPPGCAQLATGAKCHPDIRFV